MNVELDIMLLWNCMGLTVSVVLLVITIFLYRANSRQLTMLEAMHRERFGTERRVIKLEQLLERVTEIELDLQDRLDEHAEKIENIAPTLK